MFTFFTHAEMYPWMGELKKGDGSSFHDFHHGSSVDTVNYDNKSLSLSFIERASIMANWSAIGSIILPNIGGWASGIYFAGQIRKSPGEKSWYDDLNKPCWNPPKWVFGPAWTMLYSGMGYASYLVWEDCGGFTDTAVLPLTLYGTQLALNWAWTPIFFGLKDFKLALIEISVLSAAAVATTISFGNVNRTAGLLMLPYLGWLGFASALTYWIWKNNPSKPGAKVTEIKEDDKEK